MAPSAKKARTMLHDNSAQGHKLTDRQRRFFGFLAGGGKPTKRPSGGNKHLGRAAK